MTCSVCITARASEPHDHVRYEGGGVWTTTVVVPSVSGIRARFRARRGRALAVLAC